MCGATGHPHINTASFLSHCTPIITTFFIIVRGRFRVGIGVDINKTQFISIN